MLYKKFQRDSNKEIDEKQYSILSQTFSKDPEKGKGQSQKYFIKSTKLTYDKFMEEVKSTQKSKSCISSWSSPTLCGQCFDCQVTDPTCFCIDCFLEGHHDQHNSNIYYAPSGSCDCGNPSFINPSGFCPKHPGQDLSPDITQMTDEYRKKFITFFKAAFCGALNCKSDYKMISTLDFISFYIVIGDGLRRCAAIGIYSVCKTDFYTKLPQMSEMRIKAIIDLFGKLISDLYFLQKMSLLFNQNYEVLANRLSNCIVNNKFDDEYNSIRIYFDFMYHFFSKYSVEYCSHKVKFNWPLFLTNFISISFDTLRRTNFEYDKNFECSTLIRITNVERFLSNALSLEDQHDNIQDFINRYCNMFVDYEGMISFYVRTTPQDEDDAGYNLTHMMTIFGKINKLFTPNSQSEKFKAPNNKVFSISGCISAIYRYYQSNNVTVESIMNSVKKTKISTCLPLHHLFFCLLQNHKDTKTLVEKECNKQGIDFQQFCFLSIICPLRFLAATFQSGKFTKLNRGFIYAMKEVLNDPQCSFNGIFGLVQTIIGIAPNKEQLLEEVLETFGVFDNISDFKDSLDENEFDRQSYLLENTPFEVSIFILSLLTDKSIISLENIYFNRLRTIELLKQGRTTAEKIEEYTGEQLNNQAFADDLIDFIERVTNKKGESYFRLKNEDDFTPFFPPIHVNNRMNLLMSYGDNLIKINDYTELPREISLKSCFRTPVFIGLTFELLSLINADITFKKIGLALFVCLVKNGPKIPDDSFNVENPISISGKNLKEIISELTKVENQLNDVNILTINIQLGDKEPISIIKLVQSNKQLGNLAIEKAELPSSLQMKDEKINQKIKDSKAKAALLRERLMKDFQNRRKQFGESSERVSKSQITKPEPPKQQQQQQQQQQVNNDNDEDDSESNQDFNESEIVCNVCLSNQDDIYGFPCLSLPTTLPMIVNDQLHKLNTPQANIDDTFTMNICSHHIHYKCYIQLLKEELRRKEENEDNEQPKKTSIKGPICELYHCTMDRGYRNCFLPLFESPTDDEEENPFTKNPSIITKVAIKDFIRRAYNERASSYISIPMKSYASIVMMFEIRHRKRPDTLDAANIPILLRNLLLTLYHGLHQRAVKEDLTKSLNDPLYKLVYEIIKSENPVDDFIQNVQKIASEIKKTDYLYEFLRRAKIIEEFAFKTVDTKAELIDWDDTLSFKNLIESFHISTQKSDIEIELPVFETIKLPEKFIYLRDYPYCYDIVQYTDFKAVDLITGDVCYYMPTINSNSRCLEINEYVDYVYKGGVGMFLCLTGDNASNLLFYSSILDKKWDQYSVYIDQLGDSNPGFKRRINTSFSEDKLENALDALLSGNIVLY